MTELMLLYWFPAALVVAVIAALVGRPRGHFVAGLAALYWVLLCAKMSDKPIFLDAGLLAAVAAGAVIVVWVGVWMSAQRSPAAVKQETDVPQPPEGAITRDIGDRLARISSNFQDWLSTNQDKNDPWPDFGEFVRGELFAAVGARNVRAFRLTTQNDFLYPLRRTEPGEQEFPSARAGLLGHVITSGRSYYHGDRGQGELVDALAVREDEACAWCFAVQHCRRTIGVVHVGRMDQTPIDFLPQLRICEGIINLCWSALSDKFRERLAAYTDPMTGALSYRAFLDAASNSLNESYRYREPSVLVNINIDGLRQLYDSGRFDVAEDLLRRVGAVLKRRIRQDDQMGVIGGSRFVLLLRRVDSELGTLIVGQLIDRLLELCGNEKRWGAIFDVRCGVAGSGVEQPPFETLLMQATTNAGKARKDDTHIVSDLTRPMSAVTG